MTVVAPHPDDPLLLACRRVARAMDLFDEAACRALGVGRSDLRALNLLEHGPLTPATIADELGLSRASITALLDRLEAAGYLTRQQDPDNRRSIHVGLEPKTYQAFAKVYRPLGITVHSSTRGLAGQQRQLVVDSIQSMAGAFDTARQELSRSDR